MSPTARRPPRGGVDRNKIDPITQAWISRRPPRGGVDRNFFVHRLVAAAWLVAPLAGAWIETPGSGWSPCFPCVAPLAGAWIETHLPLHARHGRDGRPPRGGVDRNCSRTGWMPGAEVAPLAGAWIETPDGRTHYPARRVAPLAGAWIETPSWRSPRTRAWSPPSRGVDRNTTRCAESCRLRRRPPRGGVDRNTFGSISQSYTDLSPPSRGRGSKHRTLFS